MNSTIPNDDIVRMSLKAGEYADKHHEEHGSWLDAERSKFASLVADHIFAHIAKARLLTDKQIDAVWIEYGIDECSPHEFARAIEAAIFGDRARLSPLTDEEIDGITSGCFDDHAWRGTTILNREVARAVEAHHGIVGAQS